MTDKLRAAAQAALEALVESDPLGRAGTIEQLRAALAGPEDAEHGKCRHQWMRVGLDPYASARCINCGAFKDVRPPRREWVSLTDEEIRELDWPSVGWDHDDEVWAFYESIEAALKGKNT